MKKLLLLSATLSSLLFVGPTFSSDVRDANTGYEKADLEKIFHQAERGDATAQLAVGMLYTDGKGVPQNTKTAVKWFTLSAEQGLAMAQFILGTIYKEGKGVPQDDKTVIRWATQAAEQGSAPAQMLLGAIYADGKSIPQNYVLAHMWWNIAASNGDETARFFRDKFAQAMSPADIADAQQLAHECLTKNYQGC